MFPRLLPSRSILPLYLPRQIHLLPWLFQQLLQLLLSHSLQSLQVRLQGLLSLLQFHLLLAVLLLTVLVVRPMHSGSSTTSSHLVCLSLLIRGVRCDRLLSFVIRVISILIDNRSCYKLSAAYNLLSARQGGKGKSTNNYHLGIIDLKNKNKKQKRIRTRREDKYQNLRLPQEKLNGQLVRHETEVH